MSGSGCSEATAPPTPSMYTRGRRCSSCSWEITWDGRESSSTRGPQPRFPPLPLPPALIRGEGERLAQVTIAHDHAERLPLSSNEERGLGGEDGMKSGDRRVPPLPYGRGGQGVR